MTLLPALAPKWAKEKYGVGTKKVAVDALEYLPQVNRGGAHGWMEEEEGVTRAHGWMGACVRA